MTIMPFSGEQASTRAPSVGRAAFWRPAFPVRRGLAAQIPYLFWLLETLHPSTIIGIGLTRADALFALCQAVGGLDRRARVWGFGTWSAERGGNDGPGAVPEALRRHNLDHYEGFSRLAFAETVPASLARFQDNMFDMVLVDAEGVAASDLPDLSQRLASLCTDRGAIVLLGAIGDEAMPGPKLARLLAGNRPAITLGDGGTAMVFPIGAAAQMATQALVDRSVGPDALPNQLDRLGLAARFEAEGPRHPALDPGEAESTPTGAESGADTQPTPVDAEGVERWKGLVAETESARLREIGIITDQLETLAAEIHEARRMAAEAESAREASAAELAEVRISTFDQVSDLQSENMWLKLEAGKTAERLRSLETDLGRAKHDLDRKATELATVQASLSETQNRLASETTRLTGVAADLRARLDSQKKEASKREAARQIQLRLRDWQNLRLRQKPRFGRLAAPSGGSHRAEVEAVSRHPLFDADWYMSIYADVRGTGLSAAEHFVRHGFYEGRNPGPGFRTIEWFAANPEALAGHRNPLLDPNLKPMP